MPASLVNNDGTLSSNSSQHLVTEQAIKTYVDNSVSSSVQSVSGNIVGGTPQNPTVNETNTGFSIVGNTATYFNEIGGSQVLNLGSTDAADISVADAGNNFTATNVEDVLTELASSGSGPSDTDGLPEGSTNLYYTDARVAVHPDVFANTAKVGITTAQANEIIANTAKVSADGSVTSHSDITSAGSGQVITTGERNNIHLDDDVETVTGTLVDNTDPRNPVINIPGGGINGIVELTGDVIPGALTEPTELMFYNNQNTRHNVRLVNANFPIGSKVRFTNNHVDGDIEIECSGGGVIDGANIFTFYYVYGAAEVTLIKVANGEWYIDNASDMLLGDVTLTSAGGSSQQLITRSGLTLNGAHTRYKALRWEFVITFGANSYIVGAAYSSSSSPFISAPRTALGIPAVSFGMNGGGQNTNIISGLQGSTNGQADSLAIKVYGIR